MKHLAIVGPTGSGKSALALHLARRHGAEIVSMDAFQIYRGMDIGTAKPTRQELAEVPHHLIDLVEPVESFSVADYLQHAGAVIHDLIRRNKPAIWVGGTGFYFRALRQGLSAAPQTEPDILEELEKKSTEELVAEIQKVDPKWAEKADLQNRRRLTRALAVWRQTGRPFSAWQQEALQPLLPQLQAICLMPQMDSLRQMLRQRIERMWQEGWPDEVQKLQKIQGWENSQSASALGYSEVSAILKGEMDQKDGLEQVALKTGQFAKRQLTWFRSERNLIHTIPMILPLSSNSIEDFCASLDSRLFNCLK